MSDIMKITAKTIDEAITKASTMWNFDARKYGYKVIQEPSKGIFGFGSKDAIIEIDRALAGKPAEAPVEKKAPKAEPAVEAPVVKEEKPAEKPVEKVAPVKEAPAKVEEPKAPAVEETTIVIEEAPVLVEENLASAAATVADLPADASAEDVGLAFLAPILKALDVDPVITVTESEDVIRFDASGEHVGILIGRRGETLNAIQFLMSLVVNAHLDKHKGVVFDVENYRERQAEKLRDLAKRQAEKCKRTHRRITLSPMNAAERRIIHITLEDMEGVSSFSEGNEPNRRVVIVNEDNQ